MERGQSGVTLASSRPPAVPSYRPRRSPPRTPLPMASKIPPPLSERISTAEALAILRPIMRRSTFFREYRFRPDIIERLDIREVVRDGQMRGKLTFSRKAVEAWAKEMTGQRAYAVSGRALRFGESTAPPGYGKGLALLISAHERGTISDAEFIAATRDLFWCDTPPR